jgi:hypothetical protein
MFSQDSDGALPTTARRAKRENGGLGGGSPRKSDNLLAGPSDLSKHQKDQLRSRDGALPTTAHRAKRENGGLGEHLPGGTMTYYQARRILFFPGGFSYEGKRSQTNKAKQVYLLGDPIRLDIRLDAGTFGNSPSLRRSSFSPRAKAKDHIHAALGR